MLIPAHFPGSRRSGNILTLTLQLRRVSLVPESCKEKGAVTIPPSQTFPKFPGFGAFSHWAAHTIPAANSAIISKEFLSKELFQELYPIWDPLSNGWISWDLDSAHPLLRVLSWESGSRGSECRQLHGCIPARGHGSSLGTMAGNQQSLGSAGPPAGSQEFPLPGTQIPINPKSHHPSIHPQSHSIRHKFPFHGTPPILQGWTSRERSSRGIPWLRTGMIPWDPSPSSCSHPFALIPIPPVPSAPCGSSRADSAPGCAIPAAGSTRRAWWSIGPVPGCAARAFLWEKSPNPAILGIGKSFKHNSCHGSTFHSPA